MRSTITATATAMTATKIVDDTPDEMFLALLQLHIEEFEFAHVPLTLTKQEKFQLYLC